jgi:hypothetical protein
MSSEFGTKLILTFDKIIGRNYWKKLLKVIIILI